jgi:hypothetical protein
MRRWALAVTAVVVALGLLGCGDDATAETACTNLLGCAGAPSDQMGECQAHLAQLMAACDGHPRCAEFQQCMLDCLTTTSCQTLASDPFEYCVDDQAPGPKCEAIVD